MARGPKGEKRPDDPAAVAVAALKIILGESTEEIEIDPDSGKDQAAVSLGRRGGLKGGKARADALTSERRHEIAKKADPMGSGACCA